MMTATRIIISSIRSLSTAPRVVTLRPSLTKQDAWKRAREESLRFLQLVESGALPAGMASIKVKNLLIQLVNLPRHAEKGIVAARLLEAGQRDLDAAVSPQKEHWTREMRGKLYQLTVEAWLGTTGGENDREKAWAEAERLLWEMLNNAKERGLKNRFYCNNIQQNVENVNGTFALLVFGFCKGGGKQQRLSTKTMDRLEAILDEIHQLWDDPRVRLVPSTPAVDAILYYLFKVQRAQDADRLLNRVLETKGNPFLKPSLHGLNTVISAHAKDGDVQRTKQIIDLMLTRSTTNKHHSALPQPNVVSFNILLDAIVQRGDRDAGHQAEHVLQWMEELSLHPNTTSFTTTISAWANSRHPDAAERAEAILRHCIDLQVSGARTDVAPNDVTFGAVIHAWSLSGRPDATEKALAVVELMNTLYEEQNIPREKLTQIFNSLIMAFARSKKDDACDKALECMRRMENLGIPFDAGTNNSVMTAMMQSGNGGPQRALDYFRDLEVKYLAGDSSVQLDVISFNLALNALSTCDRETAPAQAMDLLKRMMDNADIDPTSATFNTVMKILARSSMEDSALRCEQLLEEMQRAPFSETTRPSVVTYSTCISAWGYTRLPDRYERMSRLLHQMVESYQGGNRDAQPNAVPFNAVLIGCCCGVGGQETALRWALDALDQLRRTLGVRPNQQTYPLVFRCIKLNTKPGERRDHLLLLELERCVKDGLLCSQAIAEIEEASPRLLKSNWPNNTSSYTDAIPSEWRRNVSEPRKSRKA